jgi:hypothetical protein
MYELPTISTQNHTVINHSYALNVVDLTTVKTAKKKHQRNIRRQSYCQLQRLRTLQI